jgi:hypothetical protein
MSLAASGVEFDRIVTLALFLEPRGPVNKVHFERYLTSSTLDKNVYGRFAAITARGHSSHMQHLQ